jgi:hypothetical protein
MGLDLVWHNNTWIGRYYINRDQHPYRKNKLTVKLYGGNIYVFEQGGPHMSIIDWLIQFGGALNKYAAISILKRGCGNYYVMPGQRERGEIPARYITKQDYNLYLQNERSKCPLFVWMTRLFGFQKTDETWSKYGVTSDFKGNVVFWYFDVEGRICYDKVMKYGFDGHRDHSFGGGRHYKTADGYTARPFYGSNLIVDDAEDENDADNSGKRENNSSQSELFMVESEKTALICAIVFPQYTWLSCGGKANLKNLDNRFVLLPDMDAVQDWSQNKKEAKVCEWWVGNNVSEKDDIADLVIRKIYNKEHFSDLEKLLSTSRV